MSRFAMPLAVLASLLILAGCGQTPAASPSEAAGDPAVTTGAASPTFELSLAHADAGGTIPDTGPYVTDPGATTNTCTKLSDGFWKVDYSGGDPYVRIALLIGPEAGADGRSEDVSAEIVIGSPLTTLINFDQPGYRSGDAPGRSTASVETTTGPEAITFDISATTPRAKVDFSDYDYDVVVDLTVTCPT